MKLQFEVNGQVYFLNFEEQEKRWFLIRPTNTGVLAVPVYVDAVKYEWFGGSSSSKSVVS